MPLKILYEQFKKQFTIEIENKINKFYQSSFQKSDNDFTLLIKTPHIYEEGISAAVQQARIKLYNEVYNEIAMLNYLILRDITNIFNDKNSQKMIFDFLKLDVSKQREKLKELLTNVDFNKATKFLELNNADFTMIQAYDDVVYPPENYDLIDLSYRNLQSQQPGTSEKTNNRNSYLIVNNIIPKPDAANQASIQVYLQEIANRSNPMTVPASNITVKHVYDADRLCDVITHNLYKRGNKGPFYATFNSEIAGIGSKFNLSKAEAEMENGLLKISIPFADEAKPKSLKIK